MVTAERVCGAVLTGGGSTRMGRDKAFVEIDGIGMGRRVAMALSGAGIDRVVAVGGDLSRLQREGFETVADQWPGEGPLGGILSAMSWSPLPYIVVVACDIAMISTSTVRQLMATIEDSSEADALFAETGRTEPLCGIWRVSSAIEALRGAFDAGERAVHRALDSLVIGRIGVGPADLYNINTPDDLQQRLT